MQRGREARPPELARPIPLPRGTPFDPCLSYARAKRKGPRTSRPASLVSLAWTSVTGSVVVWAGDARGSGRARARARRAARIGFGSRGALPDALASFVPGGLSRHPRRRRRRGHRAGVVPRGDPCARSLRPQPSLRTLAPPHRRQSRDRLDARAEASRRGGARGHAACAGRAGAPDRRPTPHSAGSHPSTAP